MRIHVLILASFFTLVSMRSVAGEVSYLQALRNKHIREIGLRYRIEDQEPSREEESTTNITSYITEHWILSNTRLQGSFSCVDSKATDREAVRVSKPSRQDYGFEKVSLSIETNDLDGVEISMNLLFRGEWLPPLPAKEEVFKDVCPLLGCYVYGNPHIQIYEGEYYIKSQGVEPFKGKKCLKFQYNVIGPFSTYFQKKGILGEDEQTALIKFHQDFVLSGSLLVGVETGIIHKRIESVEFNVAEYHRVDIHSDWVKTKEHANISRERTWVVVSVETIYR